jgi:ATP-dependent helicase/DNAse subunit B
MRLLTGPAGAGKTTIALEQFREALKADGAGVRLLVPTATLAQHLQNQLARDGAVFRGQWIQTLHGFAEAWTADVPQVSDEVFSLLVEDAARRVSRPEFARVAHFPGFCAALVDAISEFASAGCDSVRLARYLPDAPLPKIPLAEAFVAVYREVDRELASRAVALRARRLELAAERIEAGGLNGIRSVWLDGFHALPDPELRLIAAIGSHADLTMTLSDADLSIETRERLAALGFREERAARGRRAPAEILVAARNIEREAEEIARRILQQAASGLRFRDMGIVVRPAGAYVPVLRSTLERFGIPAHFYFDARLEEHPVVRYLGGAVDAMLSGWDHARTLAAMRLGPRFADQPAMDRFDFAVREQLPNAGLGDLRSLLMAPEGHALPGAEPLLHKLDRLATLEEWRSFSMPPRDWAVRFRDLRHLFRPAVEPIPTGPLRHQAALLHRSQAEVLDLFDQALDDAAQALPADREISIEPFWRAVQSVLRLKPLRLRDGRRNVVHVLPAHEARQWVLPVVFVCGMVERQFPQFHQQDLFFPDAARRRLNQAGVRVRTTAEFEREERALFDSAIGRASLLVVLTYPQCDSRGQRTLPSLYLDGRASMRVEDARAASPQPRSRRAGRPPVEIRAPGLLARLTEKTARLSPTSLETYLQCPFEYFAGRTLHLQGAPKRPDERLDFPTQGNIVHEVLKEWWPRRPSPIAPVFERVFERYREKRRIRPGYHTERLRNSMLEDLQAFAADTAWPPGLTSRMEEGFTFALETPEGVPGIEITGKIDRLDTAPDGRAYVIDYKYSATAGIESKLDNERLLQAQLYGMAAERSFGARLAGMFYVGLKREVVYVGWSADGLLDKAPFPEDWFERARERTLAVVEQIRAGRMQPDPADTDHCEHCDFRDACRVETRRAEELAREERA